MEAIEFIKKYQSYVGMIEKVVKTEYLPVIEKLKEIDPHDLVRPDTFFESELKALGMVFYLFIQEKTTIYPQVK